jgi:hypothetical protein
VVTKREGPRSSLLTSESSAGGSSATMDMQPTCFWGSHKESMKSETEQCLLKGMSNKNWSGSQKIGAKRRRVFSRLLRPWLQTTLGSVMVDVQVNERGWLQVPNYP